MWALAVADIYFLCPTENNSSIGASITNLDKFLRGFIVLGRKYYIDFFWMEGIRGEFINLLLNLFASSTKFEHVDLYKIK